MLLGHVIAIFCVESFHRDVIHMEIMLGVAVNDKTYNENVSLETMGFLRSKYLKD